jgi:hypothetical protein
MRRQCVGDSHSVTLTTCAHQLVTAPEGVGNRNRKTQTGCNAPGKVLGSPWPVGVCRHSTLVWSGPRDMPGLLRCRRANSDESNPARRRTRWRGMRTFGRGWGGAMGR